MEARWVAFSGFVSELPVVLADVVGLQRAVVSAAEAVSGVRAVADSGMRAAVFVMPAVKQPGESSSIRSSSPAGLSSVKGEMLAVVGRGITSQNLSAR